MKKVLKVLSAAMLSAIVAVSATAVASAAGLNAAEEKVMTELKGGVTLSNGETVSLPQARINEAENYLLNDVDLTDDQANAIITQIDAAKDYVAQSGAKSLAEIDKDKLMGYAQAASDNANLGVKVSLSGGKVVVSVPSDKTPGSSSGPSSSNDPIKTTGFDVPSVAAVAGVGILMVSAAGIYLAKASKKESVDA